MKKLILAFFLLTMLSGIVYSQQIIEEIRFNSIEGYYMVTYKYPDSDSVYSGTIMPRNNVVPVINASVIKPETAVNFKYVYELTNDVKSLQLLRRFYINSRLPVSNISKPNSEWLSLYSSNRKYIFWSKVNGIPGITPGNTVSNFSFESNYPPSITTSVSENTFWVSFPKEDEGPFGQLNQIIDSLSSEGVEKLTLAPWFPDSSLSLESLTDTLETFRFRSCEELEWANDTSVCTRLEDDLSEVKTALGSEDSLTAANALKRFIDLVEAEKETSLTSEGYALLYFNAEYLRRRLDDAN